MKTSNEPVIRSVNDLCRDNVCYGPKVQSNAPNFEGIAILDFDFVDIKLADFKNKKYVLLCFYPSNFANLCRTELLALDEAFDEFEKRNVQIIACSVDSTFSHLNWVHRSREEGGVGNLKFYLLSDATKKISWKYGVLLDAGTALRGTFIIDKSGLLRYAAVNDTNCGRNTNDILRTIDAIQYVDENKKMCPANWTKDSAKQNEETRGQFQHSAPVYS